MKIAMLMSYLLYSLPPSPPASQPWLLPSHGALNPLRIVLTLVLSEPLYSAHKMSPLCLRLIVTLIAVDETRSQGRNRTPSTFGGTDDVARGYHISDSQSSGHHQCGKHGTHNPFYSFNVPRWVSVNALRWGLRMNALRWGLRMYEYSAWFRFDSAPKQNFPLVLKHCEVGARG